MLVPDDAIPKLAEQIDSPTMFRVLLHLQKTGFILNGDDVDQETAAVLQRLVDLRLVDPGYDDPTNGKPFIWVRNHNGDRVLKYFEGTFKLLKIHSRAETALAALSERDRQAVRGAAYSLLKRDPASWPRELVTQLRSDKPVFLMRVTPDLRAFITVLDSGDIELSDIVREETLRFFSEGQSEVSGADDQRFQEKPV